MASHRRASRPFPAGHRVVTCHACLQAGGLDALASEGVDATPRRASGRATPFDLRREASVPLHSPEGYQGVQRQWNLQAEKTDTPTDIGRTMTYEFKGGRLRCLGIGGHRLDALAAEGIEAGAIDIPQGIGSSKS